MITEKNSVIKIRTEIGGKGEVVIRCAAEIGEVRFCVAAPDGERNEYRFVGGGKEIRGEFAVSAPRLWSVERPQLYRFTADILCGGECERAEGNFAFRSLSTDGKYILLNGAPVYVRGYIRGTTAHDHANNARLPDGEFYRKNVREAKKYGFNYVRFHSVVPSEDFLSAADEEGLLVHVELREPHDIYNNLEEMVTTGKPFVSEEFLDSVIDRLYNHPSFAVYCIGNEIKNSAGAEEQIASLRRMIEEKDGTRLFLDTCAWGANGRPNTDLDVQHFSYYFPFGKHADMFENTEHLLVVKGEDGKPMKTEGTNAAISRTLSFRVPLFAHEVCHYTALRDFSLLKEKFKKYGAPCPWWVDEELKMIRAKGMQEEYGEMYRASKRFQFLCWKAAFERLRASNLLGGFHFLQLADTDVYENSNGILDCFDDETGIGSDEFLRFNGDRVLLADLQPYLFYGDREICVPVSLSNCGADAERNADFSFRMTDATGKVYAEGALPAVDVSRKGVYEICKLKIRLPRVGGSLKLSLETALNVGNGRYAENSWEIWVYEEREKRSYAEFVSYEKDGVVVTDDLGKAVVRLNKGEKVCLVYRSDWTRHVAHPDMPAPALAFRASWNRFKPVIWDRGTNYGGICRDGLFSRYGFASGKYLDLNYSVLTEDCDKIVLDGFPCKPTVLLSGIDKSCRDRFDAYKGSFNLPELMYDRTLRRFAYLFELRVGEGSLLVCGLNMMGLDRDEPSTAAMADFILQYLSGEEFSPANGTDAETFLAYLKECAKAPVKERMMTQFWQLDEEPVESAQYWKRSRAYLTEDAEKECAVAEES